MLRSSLTLNNENSRENSHKNTTDSGPKAKDTPQLFIGAFERYRRSSKIEAHTGNGILLRQYAIAQSRKRSGNFQPSLREELAHELLLHASAMQILAKLCNSKTIRTFDAGSVQSHACWRIALVRLSAISQSKKYTQSISQHVSDFFRVNNALRKLSE